MKQQTVFSSDEIDRLWQSVDDRLVSRAEVAAMLGITRESLANGLSGREPRSIRVGRLVKYRVGDLRAFVNSVCSEAA